ncbi:hypothetical protein D9615_007896 [Tricholomella constricta]|uniref:Uncharacterized protein n=1 Tax=Tricholomella constricta TaxID=117010 RepID=A0A8H5M136_9AGAR|nr:hypothetical protein D9615_007896 [Tricholomella constricta]
MAAKTISSGTLGLRFMQNAQRAKQLKEVEAERAPVKDDGQWEVEQKIRDAWGPASSSSSQAIAHETSYLPFLFSSEPSISSSDPAHKPKGRRVFNKHGVEEVPQEKEPELALGSATPDDQKRSKVHPRPKSISGGSGGLFGFPEQQQSKPKSTKTAKQAIYDNAGVGEDLRRTKQRTQEAPSKPVFLKPVGVDDPLDSKPPSSGTKPKADSEVIQVARSKKTKRERSGTNQVDGEDTKRKKKKKSTS